MLFACCKLEACIELKFTYKNEKIVTQLIQWFKQLRVAQLLSSGSFALGLLFLLLAAWLLAQLTWRLLVPITAPHLSPLADYPTANIVFSQQGTQQGIERIQALYLFGREPSDNNQTAIIDAPVTSLNIRLVGLTVSNDPNLSAAIVQQGSEQTTYITGETIAKSRAVVKEIRADRIILEHNQRLESLWLEGRDGDEAPLLLITSELSRQPVAAPPNSDTVRESSSHLSIQQQRLLDVIAISPEQRNGNLLGYKVEPKDNADLLQQLGLQAGDLIVAMNGYDLTNMAEALALMNQLDGLTQAHLRILRDGAYMDIDVHIPAE